ncbi:MAG: ABC transporter ATP-binding protein [Chloroflexota bacterium]
MDKIILQTENLTKRFGELTAVDGLNLEVHEGEVFGFLGPNGAGKTTSISMMCGLLKPDAGRVILHGQTLDGGNAEVRARVGVCPQEIVLWERLTCFEQLVFIGQMYGISTSQARQRSQRLLEELDLLEKRNKQARTLSGGLQRRLNLAMALVHDPEIVVLDEPEAGLDPQSRVRVREYIQSLAHVKTVILTTHNMDEAERLADRVAIIDHGQLLVVDTPKALKKCVGAGDVLEIGLVGALGEDQRQALTSSLQDRLGASVSQVLVDIPNRLLTVRALNAVGALPQILETCSESGLQPGEVRLRQNTLEDVFIQLTGRRLRE